MKIRERPSPPTIAMLAHGVIRLGSPRRPQKQVAWGPGQGGEGTGGRDARPFRRFRSDSLFARAAKRSQTRVHCCSIEVKIGPRSLENDDLRHKISRAATKLTAARRLRVGRLKSSRTAKKLMSRFTSFPSPSPIRRLLRLPRWRRPDPPVPDVSAPSQ